MTLASDGSMKRRAALAPATRGPLACVGGQPVWAEGGDEDRKTIRRAADDATHEIVETGLVSALAPGGDGLVWAEVHGEADEAVSVLRTAAVDGSRPRRIGRDTGTVTAMIEHDGSLYWSSDDGLQRHRLER
jgi:hypothetical protein